MQIYLVGIIVCGILFLFIGIPMLCRPKEKYIEII